MLTVQGLSYSYPSGKKIVFDDFVIHKGQHSLLLGDSGTGKTTLLHLIGGLLRNYSGLISVDGTELATLSDAGLDKFRGRYFGFIFQKLHLIRSLDVRGNLEMAPWLAGLAATPERATNLLRTLGLGEKVSSQTATLSQGQAQRVAIARAVMNSPAIILADEPTSALDDRNCQGVIELLISTANEAGSTLIVATHDQRLRSVFPGLIQLKS